MAIGAAAGAGLIGIQLTGDLTTSAVLALVCAYGTTLSNTFGSATKSLGSACSKVYDKTLDLQEEYELIQKAKSAIDTTVNVADNLNSNYQITGKIDEKLKLSAAVDKVLAKVDDIKSKATRAGDPQMTIMESSEPTSKAMAIGAAAGAGLLGVQLTGDLTTSAVLAIVCAYGTTLSNEFGSATKTLGSACSKVYDKTRDLQEEYELIQKAKSAID